MMKDNNAAKGKKDWKETAFIIAMLAWPLLHFLVFWLYVNANTFYLTFFNYNTQLAQYEWYGFTRFENLIRAVVYKEDASIINYLRNSLTVFPINNFIMLPLSFSFAYFLSKKIKFSGFFRLIFFLPSILSTVVLTMAYRFMFNPEFGTINLLYERLFGSSPDWFSSMSPTAMPMVFMFTIWSGLGYKILLLGGAVERIPQEVIEAGKIDGVTMRRELFQVVLPLVMPTISTFFILNTLGVFGYFLHPMLLAGESGGVNGSTGTIALRVVHMMQLGSGEDAAAMGLLFSMIGVPFILFIKWFMEKITPDVGF